MQIKNSSSGYGLVSILLHWLIAVTIFGLTAAGLWMVDLNYYSPWYKAAPFWHKSIGIALAAALLLRLIWRLASPVPDSPANHKRWEVVLAHLMHRLLYILLIAILASGYLISTAKGQGISVFGWFELPALISGIPRQADIAGELHFWFAMALLGCVTLHAIGALKHHFVDHDSTLIRMLRPGSIQSKEK